MLDILGIILGLIVTPRFAGCLILGIIIAIVINSYFGEHPYSLTVSVFLFLALMVTGLLWDIHAAKNRKI